MEFGPHRLMLRPRESRNLRLIAHDMTLKPAATIAWAHDVSGNAVATATFHEKSDVLVIDSFAELTLDVEQWPVFDIAASAANYPFLLTEDDMTDLGALRLQGYLDSYGQLRMWAQGFVAGNPTGTLALLKDICAGVAARVAYEVREGEGTQSPVQTLARNQGSCRDFAALFVDAVRSLGFGARIVSGYLYDPDRTRSVQPVPDRRMRGQRSMCPARGGLRLIQPIEVSAVSISSRLLSLATFGRPCLYPAISSVVEMRLKEWMYKFRLRFRILSPQAQADTEAR